MNRAKIPFDPAKFPFFYGYMIFFCSSMGMLMSGPGQTTGISAFTNSLIAHLHITRFELSITYMLGTIASAVLIGWFGKVLDIFSVRRVVSLSVIGLGCFLFYMAYCDKIADFFGGGIVAAMVVATIGFWMVRFCGQGILSLTSRNMLMKWFDQKRGRANAFLGVFIVVTFSFMPPIFNALQEATSWRGAWVILGIISICYSLFVLIFYRDKPEDSGLLPDGVSMEERDRELREVASADREVDWEYGAVLKNYSFWIFNIGLSMYSLIITAVTFHIESIFQVAGRGSDEAFGMFKYAAIIGVVVNIACGFLADGKFFKHRLHWLLLILLLGLIGAMFGVVLLESSALAVLLIIIGHGVSSGVFGATSSLVWPRYYGRAHLGQVSGLAMSFMILFSAIGPSIFGWSYEYCNGYSVGSYIIIGVLVLFAFGSLWAKFPHQKQV